MCLCILILYVYVGNWKTKHSAAKDGGHSLSYEHGIFMSYSQIFELLRSPKNTINYLNVTRSSSAN